MGQRDRKLRDYINEGRFSGVALLARLTSRVSVKTNQTTATTDGQDGEYSGRQHRPSPIAAIIYWQVRTISSSDILRNMSGYDFSHLFPANVLAFSPGTTFLAVAHQNRIIVRSTSTLQIVRTWECILSSEAQVALSKESGFSSSVAGATSEIFSIDTLQWSGDSMYLLVHSREAKMAWVYGVAQEGEAARVAGMGVEGLSKVEWGKSDREVLAWTEIDVSQFKLRSTVY